MPSGGVIFNFFVLKDLFVGINGGGEQGKLKVDMKSYFINSMLT